MFQQNAYGIDVGKQFIHISSPNDGKPRQYPVHKVDTNLERWYDHLKIKSPALIVFEPTGVHYLKPIIIALQYLGIEAEYWIVNNNVTRHLREAFVSNAKTDDLDARALAYIAMKIQLGDPPIGTRPYNFHEDEIVYSLRMLINQRERLIREQTRALNRIDQLAHGIFPVCAVKKSTYLNCAQAGYITPEEIHHLATMPRKDRPEGLTGQALYHIGEFAKLLPREISVSPITRRIIADLCNQLNTLEPQIAQYEADIVALITTCFPRITELWRTVPYINDNVIACYIVACSGRVESVKQFQRCLGTAPTTRESGQKKGTAKPRGYRYAKRSIHMQAFGMTNTDNVISRYFKQGNSLGACKRKLAGILASLIIKNTPYEER